MLITQTPLRISLAGGGTDLPAYCRETPGAVVSTAIDKYIYVIVHKRFDQHIVVGYMKKEVVDRVDDIQHELVREALRKTGISAGIEITIMADIPSSGSGLGSSSSLTVGLLNALYGYAGEQVDAERLAREACEIEIDICRKPIGRQDQYIAAYGGLRYMEFLPDGRVTVEDIAQSCTRPELGARLLLFYTNVTRKADPILEEQSARTAAQRPQLDAIRQLAVAAREGIRAGHYDVIGDGLRRNWELKKDLASGISTTEIERMVATALQGGARGCKISGAGGGGFLLTYCDPERIGALRTAMATYREMPFFLDRFGSKVIFNVEAYEWK